VASDVYLPYFEDDGIDVKDQMIPYISTSSSSLY
jgi:hypothetical protein